MRMNKYLQKKLVPFIGNVLRLNVTFKKITGILIFKKGFKYTFLNEENGISI